VSYWMHGDSTTSSLTAPAGVTARGGATQTGSGRVTTLLADTAASVPAGSYGGVVLTAPTASTTSSAWTIVLRPDNGPVQNTPPTAVATGSCTNFDCAFDASDSTDSDGTIQSYAWDFGDGGTGTGIAPHHIYANGGNYLVTLTVTDDLNATDITTTNVTVPHIPPVNVITFVGGSSENSGATAHTVTVPVGVQAGDGLLLFLAQAGTASVSSPTGVTGWTQVGSVTSGGANTRVWRKVATAANAGVDVTVTLGASQKAGLTVLAYRGTDTTNPVATFASVGITTNSASRTTPVATVTSEQSWAISYWTHKDSISSALTPPAGVTTRASGTQTSSDRVTSLIADSNGLIPSGSYGGLTAMAPAASTTASAWTIILAPQSAPPANVAPTAAFTTSCTQYDCTVNASSSSDSDGVIQSYAWDFGDSGTDSGVTPLAHTYAADGTYTITLTVTDDDGDTGTATAQVTVPVTTPVDVITFVGQASSNLNAVSHTVTVPAAVQAGDGLLLFFAENTTATITDPAGWTLLDTVVANGTTTRVWRKVAGAGDAGSNVTVGVSAISKAGLSVLAYRGTSATDPVATFARVGLTNSSATRTTPVANVTGAQSWVISYWTHKDSATNALTPPAGVTVRASGTQTSGGRVTTLIADSGALVPAGTYGGLSATAAATSTAASAWTIVLAPGA